MITNEYTNMLPKTCSSKTLKHLALHVKYFDRDSNTMILRHVLYEEYHDKINTITHAPALNYIRLLINVKC